MTDDATKQLKRWQPKLTRTVTPKSQLLTVRYSPCGKMLAAGGCDGKVYRWDLTAGVSELSPLSGHDGWVQGLAFHPDGRRLFTVDSWGRLACWSYREDAKPLWTVQAAHDGWVRQVAVAADGKTIATCGADRQIRLWSAGDGQTVQELAGDQDVYSLAFHPDGKALVSGDLKGVVRQWDLASGGNVRDLDASSLYYFERIQDVGGVRRMTFDANGTTLACAGCQATSGAFIMGVPTVLLFDWSSGKLLQTLKIGMEVDGFVQDLAWHADGFLMGVTGGQPPHGMLFFQRPGDAAPFFTAAVPDCHALAVHPDGVRFVVSSTSTGINGGGRQLDANGEYPGNFSPLLFWELPAAK